MRVIRQKAGEYILKGERVYKRKSNSSIVYVFKDGINVEVFGKARESAMKGDYLKVWVDRYGK